MRAGPARAPLCRRRVARVEALRQSAGSRVAGSPSRGFSGFPKPSSPPRARPITSPDLRVRIIREEMCRLGRYIRVESAPASAPETRAPRGHSPSRADTLRAVADVPLRGTMSALTIAAAAPTVAPAKARVARSAIKARAAPVRRTIRVGATAEASAEAPATSSEVRPRKTRDASPSPRRVPSITSTERPRAAPRDATATRAQRGDDGSIASRDGEDDETTNTAASPPSNLRRSRSLPRPSPSPRRRPSTSASRTRTSC